jgi:hypothetical protein
MKCILVAMLSSIISVLLYGQTTQKTPEGAQPFTPSRIDWLTTTLQASLREDQIETDGYLLQITSPDPDTILIYVRYLPTVNREAMNIGIDAARHVIRTTAKSYDWDTWLKVREDIQMVKAR